MDSLATLWPVLTGATGIPLTALAADDLPTVAGTSVIQLVAYFGGGAVLLAVLGLLVWLLVRTWQQGLLAEVERLRADVKEKDTRLDALDAKIDREATLRRESEKEAAAAALAMLRLEGKVEKEKLLRESAESPLVRLELTVAGLRAGTAGP